MTTSQSAQPEKIVHDNLRLVHSPAKDRFELHHESPYTEETTFVGFIGYQMAEEDPEVYILQHTIVAEEYGRQGYARALATMLLDDFEKHGTKFTTQCSYIDDYLRRYPEYSHLVTNPASNH